MRPVYLDANATTRVHSECVEKMIPFLGEVWGNASSIHFAGREAKKHLEKARIQVAELLGADSSEEVIFTSGGTESDNLAIRGAAHALRGKGEHIITSSVEHRAVLSSCKSLEAEGFRVTYLKVDEYGLIDIEELREKIGKDTILISVMAANNETGTIMPVDEIGKIAAEKGVIFHTDAVQLAGKVQFDVKTAGTHLVSLSAHKMHGPKGTGALYIKQGVELDPCQYGGSQERGKRAGTENMPGIVAFAEACEIAKDHGINEMDGVKALRDMLYERVKAEVKDVKLNGHPEKRLPNTVNISFNGLDAAAIVRNLDMEGIAASSGSACTSGSAEPSHVLESMGLESSLISGAIRFSMSGYNTEEDIELTIQKLPGIIARMRG